MDFIDSFLLYWTNHLLNSEGLGGLTPRRLNYFGTNPLTPDCPASWLIVQSCSEATVPTNALERSCCVKNTVLEAVWLMGLEKSNSGWNLSSVTDEPGDTSKVA